MFQEKETNRQLDVDCKANLDTSELEEKLRNNYHFGGGGKRRKKKNYARK
jgi:hypothetical protein